MIGCGFLGGHIARGLAMRGLAVRALSHSFSPLAVEVLDDAALIVGDARDPPLVEAALADVDEVVYCVGGLQPAGAELAPATDVAMLLEPLRCVLAAVARQAHARVTFISSGGAVYGNPERIPVTEGQPTRPIGAYGRTRLAAERLLAQAHRRDGVRALILRCGNVYGEGQPLGRGQGAVGVFIDRISRGEPVALFGSGDVIRDYVYVGDLVDAVCQLVGRRQLPEVVNVGSGAGSSVRELIGVVEHAVGRDAIVHEHPPRPFDVLRLILDVTLLGSVVTWAPRPLVEGVAQLAPLLTPSGS